MGLERRLLIRSQAGGVSLVRLRKNVVFDRLLARLLEVAPDRWVLKGALALEYRLGAGTRTTMDVDLGRSDDEQESTEDFLKAQAAELGDFFVFIIERTADLDEIQEGSAVRYHVESELAGRRFEAINVDVGFNDPIEAPESLRGHDLLSFADIAPIEVPAISIAQHIAEKVHAYSRTYGAEGVLSTRVKDLVDLVLIAKGAPVDAIELRAALRQTFSIRGGRPLPPELPPPPVAWRVPYRRLAGQVGIPPQLEAAHAAAAGFLNPILSADLESGEWEPNSRSWQEQRR